MRVVIETIPHVSQRYDTVGDWLFIQEPHQSDPLMVVETLAIKVSSAPDWRSEVLVAVHELVEAVLCRAAGVGQHLVDNWDLAHPEADEPGDLPGAPYHDQHKAAEAMERLLATWLLQDWRLHEATLEVAQTGFEAIVGPSAFPQVKVGFQGGSRVVGKIPELGAPYDKAEQERWEKNKKRELKLAFLQQQDAALKKELDSIVEARNDIAGDINRLKGEGESDKEWFERTHGDASKQ